MSRVIFAVPNLKAKQVEASNSIQTEEAVLGSMFRFRRLDSGLDASRSK